MQEKKRKVIWEIFLCLSLKLQKHNQDTKLSTMSRIYVNLKTQEVCRSYTIEKKIPEAV